MTRSAARVSLHDSWPEIRHRFVADASIAVFNWIANAIDKAPEDDSGNAWLEAAEIGRIARTERCSIESVLEILEDLVEMEKLKLGPNGLFGLRAIDDSTIRQRRKRAKDAQRDMSRPINQKVVSARIIQSDKQTNPERYDSCSSRVGARSSSSSSSFKDRPSGSEGGGTGGDESGPNRQSIARNNGCPIIDVKSNQVLSTDSELELTSSIETVQKIFRAECAKWVELYDIPLIDANDEAFRDKFRRILLRSPKRRTLTFWVDICRKLDACEFAWGLKRTDFQAKGIEAPLTRPTLAWLCTERTLWALRKGLWEPKGEPTAADFGYAQKPARPTFRKAKPEVEAKSTGAVIAELERRRAAAGQVSVELDFNPATKIGPIRVGEIFGELARAGPAPAAGRSESRNEEEMMSAPPEAERPIGPLGKSIEEMVLRIAKKVTGEAPPERKEQTSDEADRDQTPPMGTEMRSQTAVGEGARGFT